MPNPPDPAGDRSSGAILALDGSSPLPSAAVAVAGRVLACRSTEDLRSSTRLLALLAEALAEAGVARASLGGVVALSGPGSFTGTRVALATALGLHLGGVAQAATLSTFEALARSAPPEARRIAAVVDALRGEWFLQIFERDAAGTPRQTGQPRLLGDAESPPAAEVVVGHGVAKLAVRFTGSLAIEPGPLATPAARAASLGEIPWDAGGLTSPLYLRPPVVAPSR